MKLLPALLSVAIAATTTAFAPHRSHPHHSRTASSAAFAASTTKLQATTNNMPICIVVEAEIKEDRMDDFLSMIEKNAVGSREEPGCIRFGMLIVVFDYKVLVSLVCLFV